MIASETKKTWSGRKVAKCLVRKMQDQHPEDCWSYGTPNWWTEHEP